MDFSGPEPGDFRNVHAMNREFLARLRDASQGALRQQLPVTLQQRAATLTDLQIDRLASAPFLLFSLRERDDAFWGPLSSAEPAADLFTAVGADRCIDPLTAAAVAFLWQLSRGNPYAARLVSGATLAWCEMLAESPLLRLLTAVASHDDLLQPRCGGDEEFWNKLLGPGASPRRELRRAAQVSTLQKLLTRDPAQRYRPLRAAACSTSLPARSVTGAVGGDRRAPSL